MRQKEDKEYLTLFHVPIQKSYLDLNIDSLIEFCYEMKRKDEIGDKRSNIGGWHSDNITNPIHPEFVKLTNKIEDAANIYHHDIHLKNTHHQKIDNIWAIINQKGHSNEYHVHPGACLSGVFYLRGGAPIVFQHPFHDITTYYWNDSIIEEWNEANSGIWTIEPELNMLLIFPPWVQHKVSINEEDTDRIVYSFNTTIHKTEIKE